MKRLIIAPFMMLLLLIAMPAAEAAQPKGKKKSHSGSVKRSSQSSPSLTWIGDIPSPKYMLHVWENNGVNYSSFNNFCKTLEAHGYYESDGGYCKPGVACISFTGGRFEMDVIVTIQSSSLRSQYYQAVKKAFGSSRDYYVSIDGDEIFFGHLYQ